MFLSSKRKDIIVQSSIHFARGVFATIFICHLLLFPVMSKKQARRVDTDNAKVDDAKAAKIKEREEERASKKKIKAKSGELVCFVCKKKLESNSAFKCGAQEAGESGGWSNPSQITSRGGCGQFAHKKCLETTKCGGVFVCDDCLEDYDCIDCDECND